MELIEPLFCKIPRCTIVEVAGKEEKHTKDCTSNIKVKLNIDSRVFSSYKNTRLAAIFWGEPE